MIQNRHYVETTEYDWLIDPETDKKIQRIPVLRNTSFEAREDALEFVQEINTHPGRLYVKNARYLGWFTTPLNLHPDLSEKEVHSHKKNNEKKPYKKSTDNTAPTV